VAVDAGLQPASNAHAGQAADLGMLLKVVVGVKKAA